MRAYASTSKWITAILLAWLPAGGASAQDWPGVPSQQRYADAEGSISMALAGDAIITRRVSVFEEGPFTGLVDLVRGATVSIVNLETLFHRFEPDVIPASQSGGAYMAADPEMAHELAWMGFDMVARANNHSLDYGIGGMEATTRAVAAAGIAQAGVGDNLALARAPAYLETPGGRVALISLASTFADQARAGSQRKDVRGRPGLNPLRHSAEYVVTTEDLADLRRVAATLGMGGAQATDRLSFLRAQFRTGAEPGVVTRAHPTDLEEIVAQVRNARRSADWVVVTSHTHERGADRFTPPQFLVDFAHAVIDAGADVYFGHGPHVLRGVEIYNGKPIFYSLGNFIFQNETLDFQPADNYEGWDLPPEALAADFHDRRAERGTDWSRDVPNWQAIVAVPVFSSGRLSEVTLHPIGLGFGLARPQLGRPTLADPELARDIVRQLQELSEPFGTRIDYVDGVGRVRIP
ncbi:MAG TPA: CapA family protein [Longimicrobiales bacterium]|nr:CapA family protein [Longimicrobiales bacterium]